MGSAKMGNKFTDITFTESVKDIQEIMGSRKIYEKGEGPFELHHEFGPDEREFLSARDSFYMATVSETGWPYVQHRGGPEGFVKVLSNKEFGFADFSGNRQYISVGNLKKSDRVALIFVDYPNRARLKILGHAQIVSQESHPELMAKLAPEGYGAKIERGFLIQLEGFDWNCPQHITRRWPEAHIWKVVTPLHEKIRDLEAKLGKFQDSEK